MSGKDKGKAKNSSSPEEKQSSSVSMEPTVEERLPVNKEVVQSSPQSSSTSVNAVTPVPSFVTQTDADGNQKAVAVQVAQPSDEDNEDEIDKFSPPQTSCWDNLIKFFCCTEFEDTILSSHAPFLLPPTREGNIKPCLVLDLDETLVHSSFFEVPEADFRMEVSMDKQSFEVFVIKRPGLEGFLNELAEHYELVIFTASVEQYARKVLQLIDLEDVIEHQLYREHCTYYAGNFVKDLTRLNRNLDKTIIVDNSPVCYQFQPENAIPIGSFISDKSDVELIYLKDFLLEIKDATDFKPHLRRYQKYLDDRFRQDFGPNHHRGSSTFSQFGVPKESQDSTIVYQPESDGS